jgi:hypothetical protein
MQVHDKHQSKDRGMTRVKVITDKDVGEEVNVHKNQEYKYHKGWS